MTGYWLETFNMIACAGFFGHSLAKGKCVFAGYFAFIAGVQMLSIWMEGIAA